MLKPNPLNTSSDTYKVTRTTPELLQAACDVVNSEQQWVDENPDMLMIPTIVKLKKVLLKAGCVETDSDSGECVDET